MNIPPKDDFLVDIIINAGELNESGYNFKDNDLKHHEVVKHNVLYSEFRDWLLSDDRFKRENALKDKARERWGKEWWMHYEVCCFCTTAAKD